MDDIAYIHACSLAKEALPKITNVDAQLLHKEHTIQFRSLAQLVDYVDQSVEKLHTDVKTASTSFATTSQVQSIADQQTKLERDMHNLTTKVEAIDSKLELLLSVFFPGVGHDAKKGEKLHKDAEPKGDDGNQEKKTSDAAVTEQSTHVSPSGHTLMVGQGASNPDASNTIEKQSLMYLSIVLKVKKSFIKH